MRPFFLLALRADRHGKVSFFQKKIFFEKFSFGTPRQVFFRKGSLWGTKEKVLKKKFLEKSGLTILTSAQCQQEKWSRFLFYPLGTQKSAKTPLPRAEVIKPFSLQKVCNRGDTFLHHGGLHTNLNQCNQGNYANKTFSYWPLNKSCFKKEI